MKEYNYFDVPTQVKFWDYENGYYVGGIAYRGEIICGCCGSVFRLSEVYKLAPNELNDAPIIIVKGGWKSISYEISKKSW